MSTAGNSRLTINVVELNPHAPRPFAFSEIALCLRDSIRGCGFTSEVHVNRADPNAISLVLGAVPPLLGPLAQLDPRKTAIVNFEQLGSTSAIAGPEYLAWLRDWLVVDYHSDNIKYLRAANGRDQQALELPIVPAACVACEPLPSEERSVDVLFYGTPSERRNGVIEELRAGGMTVETVAGAYGPELAPAMRRARIVLHAHFYETGLFPIARMLQPVASGVPVVCENSTFSRLSDWSGSGILFAPYEGLVDACRKLLDSPQEQQERARRARDFAAQVDFATPLHAVLEAIATRMRHSPPEVLGLPPEPHVQPPPVAITERQLGKGRYGKWAVALLLLLTLYTLWQAMR